MIDAFLSLPLWLHLLFLFAAVVWAIFSRHLYDSMVMSGYPPPPPRDCYASLAEWDLAYKRWCAGLPKRYRQEFEGLIK